MTDRDDERPDPDLLLRRMQEEEARARRGKLKIFFGFAPGVGKTYRMLLVAQDLKLQRVDVVVGFIEMHRRFDTTNLIPGLEVLPRRPIEHRGRILEEFDLDAALARKPRVLLLDELAHTNAPGSRHTKRWQDALELLDAGIDVFTTVNVQHVESLNDVVAQITHVRVRETVPDRIFDEADEIELVDIAPEELLQRLGEGKVYLGEQARRAKDHFFKRGNLLALRELALRRTAQHVDEDVQEYRERHGVEATWAAGERILVCVGAAPSSARLIRAAARMGAGFRAPWVAAYVDSAGILGDADRDRLDAHLRLAESLGGTTVRLSGPRVSAAILDYARKQNVTRILIGKPTHPRLRDRIRGSLLDEIVRGSGDIDLHVMRGETQEERRPRTAPGPRDAPSAAAYVQAVGLVGLTTGAAALIRSVFPLPDLEVLYLLAVMLAAIRLGRGPSILAAGLGVAAYDFFFVPPFLTFAVADARYLLTFGMMFGVGFVVSELTTRLKRQEAVALQRGERTGVLYALTRELATAEEPEASAAVVCQRASEVFGARAYVLRPAVDGALETTGTAPSGAALDPKELGVARWCLEHGEKAGLGTDTLPGSRILAAPLRVGDAILGVLALEPREPIPLRGEQREFLDAFCRQAAFAFERNRLAGQAQAAALRARTEEVRSSLLSAVSHDLRTPLAVITGTATSLRDDTELDAGTRAELVESICDEAERLERLVSNLLDMTRLASGAIALKREWVPLVEVVGSALSRLESRLGDRSVAVDLPVDLPLVSLDPVLFEQAFLNLFENAAKYTPEGSPIEVRARVEGDAGPRLVVEIADRGPGFAPGTEESIFEKFYRGPHVGVAGVGLGLPICRAILAAHGGVLKAENRPGGGAVFRMVLPLIGSAPTMGADGGEAGEAPGETDDD